MSTPTNKECCNACDIVMGQCVGCECHTDTGETPTFSTGVVEVVSDLNWEAPTQPERTEKIRKGAEDFANRFEGVMKDLAEEGTQPESKG